jgi:hypothetical protein
MAREQAARQAVHDSLRRLRRDVRNAVDPRVWVRRHPWLAVTIAAAAGFALSDNIAASQHQTPQAPPPAEGSSPSAAQPSPPPSTWRSAISREILAVMRPILIAAVTQHLKSTAFADEPPKPPSHDPSAA